MVQLLEQWLQKVEVLEGLQILLGELRLGVAELFAERGLLLSLPYVFWRRNVDGRAPSRERTTNSRLPGAILPT